MKHSYDSYGIYKISIFSKYTIRTKVIMKDAVDIEILKKAVNLITRRYSYFMVKLIIDKDGGYDFIPNDNDIAVIMTSKHNPDLCTKDVGYHLLYVDCEDNTIYFNISHALAGGKGVYPWVMSCVYQYVVEKYGVFPNAPQIRKAESELLTYEKAIPTLEMTEDSEKYSFERFRGAKLLITDYINSFINPFISSNEYYQFEFEQKDIVKFAKGSDNSVLSLFEVIMFKVMIKLFPHAKKIVGESPHNPANELGIPDSYVNILSHILFLYTKDMENWDVEKLGTAVRGNMLLQCDPMFSRYETRKLIEYYNGIDSVTGYNAKKKYARKNSLSFGKDAVHGTYYVSYTGYYDWGELVDYVDSLYHIVDGNQMLELSALGDKIFCCYQQVIHTDKYISVFKQVLDELGIPYKVQGPFKKNLVKHKI